MQRIFAIILVAVLIVPASMRVGIMVGYVLQYDAYVSILCDNKDKPELKCNGKCHLSKELTAVNKAESENPSVPGELQKELVFTFFSQTLDEKQPLDSTPEWASFSESIWININTEISLPPPRLFA
jgi:hypothetical protein